MPQTWLLHFAISYLEIPEGQARDLGIREADGLIECMRSYEFKGGRLGLPVVLLIHSACLG